MLRVETYTNTIYTSEKSAWNIIKSFSFAICRLNSKATILEIILF